jgi:hypothetical protein
VAAFILIAGDLNGQEMAQIFLKAMPKIIRFLKAQQRPLWQRLGNLLWLRCLRTEWQEQGFRSRFAARGVPF